MNMSLDCKNGVENVIIRYKGHLEFYNHFTLKQKIEEIFVPLWFILGFPGNIISIYIWSRYSTRCMVSSLYLAVLAIVDCLFFFRHLIWHLQSTYNVRTIKNAVMCQLFPLINMVLQYMPPLLILGFTVERFISVCYPFYGRKICTVERTKHTILMILFCCVIVSLPQTYFYHYIETDQTSDCEDMETWLNNIYNRSFSFVSQKKYVYENWRYQFLYFYNLLSESFFFIFVPSIILCLNVIVISKLNKIQRFRRILTRNHSKKKEEKQLSASISLLTVSFYLIFTTLPASIFQIIKFNDFQVDYCLSDDQILQDPNWKAHFRTINLQTHIELLSITHYAANFYIYICTCRQFRQQFFKIFLHSSYVHRCNQFSQLSNMSPWTIKT